MKKKLLIALAAVLVLVLGGVVALALSIDSGVKAAVEEGGSHALKVPVTLDEVDVSLTGGRASLKGFAVANPEGFGTGNAISLGEVSTEIKLSSLTSEVIEVPEIVIRNPKIAIKTKKLGLGGTNLTQLLKNINETVEEYSSPGEKPAGKPEKEEPAGEAQHYKVGRILIAGATISVSDTMLKGKELSLTLPDIEVPELSTAMTMTQIIKKCLQAMVDSAKQQKGGIADLMKKVDAEAIKGRVTGAVEDLRETGRGALDDLKKAGEGAIKGGGSDGGTDAGKVIKKAGKDARKTIKGIGDIFKKKDKDK